MILALCAFVAGAVVVGLFAIASRALPLPCQSVESPRSDRPNPFLKKQDA